jgi:50S ribosomal protein L16 3-hydroxylase
MTAAHSPFPIEIDAATGPGPLGMPPAQFLRDYWQKKPLLIRNAFPNFACPLTPEDLAGLACEEGTLARLVEYDRANDRWALRHGPFEEAVFPALPHHDWTVLVQDVDKWDADVRDVLAHFEFLPRWRMDDIMISFAATGGSVGAHIDQYDVFLLQGQGQRRWQIDTAPNPASDYRNDVDIRLLSHFTPNHDWVLQPGDMLYLPPGIPHHGVAVDPCLTISVGLRAPSAAELLDDYASTLATDAPETLRYVDADLALPEDCGEIDAAALARAEVALRQLHMNDPDRFGDWFGNFITTYRCAVQPAAADTAPLPAEVAQALAEHALLLRHPWSRMAWRRDSLGGARLYVGGQAYAMAVADARTLAAAEAIHQALYTDLGPLGQSAVLALLAAGHYQWAQEDDV